MLGVTAEANLRFAGLSVGNPRASSAVQAVADWFAPVDFLRWTANATLRKPGLGPLLPRRAWPAETCCPGILQSAVRVGRPNGPSAGVRSGRACGIVGP